MMTSKWQETWDFYGWKALTDVIPEQYLSQSDWNYTLYTPLNALIENIRNLNKDAEIGVSLHPDLFNSLVSKLPLVKTENGVTKIKRQFFVNLDATLANNVIYVYERVDGTTNVGEITINY